MPRRRCRSPASCSVAGSSWSRAPAQVGFRLVNARSGNSRNGGTGPPPLNGPGWTGTAGGRVDALYDAPFEDFTKLRNELVKELRKAGDRAAADEVAGLRKPTRAAWALNQVARGDRPTIRRVLEAGERLRKAQEDALGGGSGNALRTAGADEREAVGAAVEKAAAVLGGQASRATLERVRSSLQAAARDDAVR